MRSWFELWDRLGREPLMLLHIWGIFGYDPDFKDDMLLCCELLEFQRRHKALEDVFGDIFGG